MANQNTIKPAPIVLRNMDIDEMFENNPCDKSIVLGSFWPNSALSFESHLVKSFKECSPVNQYQPHISAMCDFYADLIADATAGMSFDYIARVLGSSETTYDHTRPQSLLVTKLCARTGARDVTNCFFKSAARPPMRSISRLSGPDALQSRVKYIVQELFVRPSKINGNVLLIDDIGNTGASTRVYAKALKLYMSAQHVCCLNLAATRFNRGKDGLGMLELNMIGLTNFTELDKTCLDCNGIYHYSQNCAAATGKITPRLRFICERNSKPCHSCSTPQKTSRRWWQFWGKK